MGLGRWLKKRGSTGSIGRWVADRTADAARAEMPTSDAIRLMLDARYVHTPMPLKGAARAVFLEAKQSGRTPTNPRDLARFVWDIEIGTELPAAVLERERRECYAILDEELARKGLKLAVGSEGAIAEPERAGTLTLPAERRDFILDRIRHADGLACRLWAERLGLNRAPIQARHSISIIVAGVASARIPDSSVDALIDLAADHLDDPQFREVLAETDVRAGLRRLLADAQSAARSSDIRNVSELVQTFLLAPVGGPTGLAPGQAESIVECSASICADTMATSLLAP